MLKRKTIHRNHYLENIVIIVDIQMYEISVAQKWRFHVTKYNVNVLFSMLFFALASLPFQFFFLVFCRQNQICMYMSIVGIVRNICSLLCRR